MFQVACNHRKCASDPHTVCESCALIAGWKICTPEDGCDTCADTSQEAWAKILKARAKRQWRQKQRSAHAGDAPDDGEEDDDELEQEPLSQQGEEEDTQRADSPRSHLSSQSEIGSHVEIVDSEPQSEASDDEIEPTQKPRSESPVRLASEIEFPDLLRFVEMNSPFTLGDPAASRPSSAFRLTSQDSLPEKEPSFLALSASQAIVDLAIRRSHEAMEASHAHQLGHIPQFSSKGSLKSYQLASQQVNQHPAIHTEDKFPFLRQVQKSSRSYVRESDLLAMESNQREMLCIQNYLDAFLTAASSVAKQQKDADPFLIRSITASANALAELVKRSINLLQQISIHRRDMALWGTTIKPSHIASLRHSPFLDSKSLFDKVTLHKVQEDFMEDQKNKVISRAAKASTSSQRSAPTTPRATPKRQAASHPMSGTPQRKRQKLQLPKPSPQRPVAAPKAQGQPKHR